MTINADEYRSKFYLEGREIKPLTGYGSTAFKAECTKCRKKFAINMMTNIIESRTIEMKVVNDYEVLPFAINGQITCPFCGSKEYQIE